MPGISVGSMFGSTSFITMMAFLVILLGTVVAWFLITGKRLQGRMLVFFVEKNRTFDMKLFKPKARHFTTDKDPGTYLIDTKKVMLVNYPFSGPKFMQRTIPCLIYARGNPEALDPQDITSLPGGSSAEEIARYTDESVIAGIVKATQDEYRKDRVPVWLVGAVLGALMLVMLILIWSMNAKIDSIAGR